ncbi:sulfurtransferase [Agromyces archimandritae]|uniref:Sulfurtransferase n=1 Tax=Agromyces archimandritae TaxID=2781962 RepID=A0A975FK73_9MICO|nr:rhodanese-like domain-containing protein [Agromyces archimandritae]QTX04053.1 sulfurtransferase [Agromyces archimandritae]
MADLELFTPLVSTQWLADHQGAETLVVLDATVLGVKGESGLSWLSGLDRYLIDGHVPDARFADLLEEFSDPSGSFGFPRPDAEGFVRAARGLGIDDGSTVVVYDSGQGQWAARLWWIFRSFGFERVAVLDGGLGAWRAEGRGLETGYVAPGTAGALTVEEQPGRWADVAEVEAIVAGTATGTLVCALPAGATSAGGSAARIPGSGTIPFAATIDRQTGLHRPAAELAELRPADERVVVYCGSGIAAAGTAFALELAGHRGVAVYDGSLNEWLADPARPVAADAA